MSVRSFSGALASEESADQTCSFASGVTATPSRPRIAASHSAAQARSAAPSIWASGVRATGSVAVAGERAAEIVPIAAHGERGGADRAAEVEREYLGAGIATELEGDQRQQHALARAGRADHQTVPDILDVKRQPEWRCSFCLRKEQRRPVEVVVALGSRPDGGQRNQVSEVEGRERRLPDIGVDVAGQAAEPSLHRVNGLGDAGEVAALDDLFCEAEFLVGDVRVLVPDRERRRHIGLASDIGPELLERRVGVERLVVGVAVEERRGLVGHHLFQDRADRLALGEPLPADTRENLGRVRLVEADRASRPTVGEGEPVELVENPRIGRGREIL